MRSEKEGSWQMATSDDFDAMMAILSAAYPNYTPPGETLALYEEELSDMPGAELIEAARRHYRQSKFFPTIAELRTEYDAAKKWRGHSDGREWKRNLEAAKAEALSAGEAGKLLAAVNEKAGTKLVTSRGMSRVVKRNSGTGADLTDEEYQERVERLKEGAGAA